MASRREEGERGPSDCPFPCAGTYFGIYGPLADHPALPPQPDPSARSSRVSPARAQWQRPHATSPARTTRSALDNGEGKGSNIGPKGWAIYFSPCVSPVGVSVLAALEGPRPLGLLSQGGEGRALFL
jgi:hypothetical protein